MAIAKLQEAAAQNSTEAFKEYVRLTEDLNEKINLRGMLKFKSSGAIPIAEVSSADHFVTCILPVSWHRQTQALQIRPHSWFVCLLLESSQFQPAFEPIKHMPVRPLTK